MEVPNKFVEEILPKVFSKTLPEKVTGIFPNQFPREISKKEPVKKIDIGHSKDIARKLQN